MSRRARNGRSAGRTPGATADRGQTAVDFAIAIGLFLVALVVVISFLPAMIDPFAGTPSENSLIADRIANQLTEYQLAGSASGTLNTTCTLYFFNTTDEASNPCVSFESDGDLDEKLGVGEDVRVNVTIEQNVSDGTSGVLCGDLETHQVDECAPDAENQYRLAAGDSPSDRASVAVARRVAFLDEYQNVTVYVRVWS